MEDLINVVEMKNLYDEQECSVELNETIFSDLDGNTYNMGVWFQSVEGVAFIN